MILSPERLLTKGSFSKLGSGIKIKRGIHHGDKFGISGLKLKGANCTHLDCKGCTMG